MQRGGHDVSRLRLCHASILIQPEGRMQLAHRYDLRQLRNVSILIQPEGRMQRPGAGAANAAVLRVSILIQPEGRMQPEGWQFNLAFLHVSILIQPEGRMQRARALTKHG